MEDINLNTSTDEVNLGDDEGSATTTTAGVPSMSPPAPLPAFAAPGIRGTSFGQTPANTPMSDFPPAPAMPPAPGMSNIPESVRAPQESSTAVDVGYSLDPGPGSQAEDGFSGQSGMGGVWGWIKGTVEGNNILNTVVEKTKTGVDSMITTLDPQMKLYMNVSSKVTVMVASDKELKIVAIRDAFEYVFGKTRVMGVASQPNSIAVQPVGFMSALKGAQQRLDNLVKNGFADPGSVTTLSAVESFLQEVVPGSWFDFALVLIRDLSSSHEVFNISAGVPIEPELVKQLEAATGDRYELKWSGFSQTIGEAIQRQRPDVSPYDWHATWTGGATNRQLIITEAAKITASLYNRWLGQQLEHHQQLPST